jgi:hypothetical protein
VQRKGQSAISAAVVPQRDWNNGLVLAEVGWCLTSGHKVPVELVEVQVAEGTTLLLETRLEIGVSLGSEQLSQTRRELIGSVVGSDTSFLSHNRSVWLLGPRLQR